MISKEKRDCKHEVPYGGWLINVLIFLCAGFSCNMVHAQDSSVERIYLKDVVHLTIEHNIAIRSERAQLRFSEGNLLSTEGQFDSQFTASVTSGMEETPYTAAQRAAAGITSLRNNISTYRLGAVKQLRNGISLSPGIEVTSTQSLGSAGGVLIQTRANLLFNLPLMRGLGDNSLAAQNKAASISLEAGNLSLRHTISTSVVEAAFAFWRYVSTYKSLDVFIASEERARLLLTETISLVDAGERPSAELDQLRANLADKITARINAEQTHFEARQNLGLAMGLSFEEIGAIPDPEGRFPAVIDISQAHTLRTDYVDNVAKFRGDLQSAYRQEKAAKWLLSAARNEVKPRFDLQFDLGYTGLSENNGLGEFLPPVGQNDVSGANMFLTLVYSLPTRNRSARGLLQQQESRFIQSQLAVADLERRVQSGVTVAIEALKQSILEVGKAREAVMLYEKSVENEKKKLRLSMATLFDVILIEDRLTNAQLNELSATVRYAQALARLSLETGAMPLQGPIIEEDLVRSLTTIPAP